MAAPTLVNASTWVAPASSTTVAPTYPTGMATGDIVYMVVRNKPDTADPTDPADWTRVGSLTGGAGTQNAGSGATRTTLWKRTVPGGGLSGTQSVTVTGGSSLVGYMEAWNAAGGSFVAETFSSWSVATGSTNISGTAGTGLSLAVDDIVRVVVGTPDDQSTALDVTAIAASGATFGTITADPNATVINAQGNDISGRTEWVPVTAGTSNTAPTVTASSNTSETAMGFVWRIRATDPNATTTPAQAVTSVGLGAVTVVASSEAASVATYNIRIGLRTDNSTLDITQLRASMGVLGADIVGCQEVDRNTTRTPYDLVAEMVTGMGAGTTSFFTKSIDFQGGEFGNCILVRGGGVISSPTRVVVTPDGGLELRSIALASVTMPGWEGPVSVAVTHLAPDAIATDQLGMVLDTLNTWPAPRVFLADTNLIPADALSIFAAKGYVLTRDGFTYPATGATAEIDYIGFADMGAVTGETTTVATGTSDHLALKTHLRYAYSGELQLALTTATGPGGSTAQTDTAASLGGFVSTTGLPPGSPHLVFPAGSATADVVDYRCFVVRNVGTFTREITVWFFDQISGGATLAVGADTTASSLYGSSSAQTLTVANVSTAPAGVTFSSPSTKATGLSLGRVMPGYVKGVWLRRTTLGGNLTGDRAVIRVSG